MKILNKRNCYCAACGEYFNSTSVFDRHRVGDWRNRGANRKCLTIEQMVARGWSINANGFWVERAWGITASTPRR